MDIVGEYVARLVKVSVPGGRSSLNLDISIHIIDSSQKHNICFNMFQKQLDTNDDVYYWPVANYSVVGSELGLVVQPWS